MNPETTPFEEFFAERMKERNMSLKKLADATGIAPRHIENLLRGDFDSMPSAPYFHGYLIRFGQALEFDGEEWWNKLKKDGVVKNSGILDTLPKNRFLKKDPPKYLWAVGVGAIIVIYLAFQAPRIFGKPSLAVSFPAANPYTAATNTITLEGTVRNADSLSLIGSNGDSEQLTVAADGTWQKGVLLQNGLNTFQLSAKKFLGGQTDIMEQVLYQAPVGAQTPTTTPASGSPTSSGATSGTLFPASSATPTSTF